MTALNQPLEVRGHRHIASVSIGITIGGALHTHPDEVLREADLALLRAKRSGRTRIEVYDPTQDKPATLHDLELEHALRSALAEHRRPDPVLPADRQPVRQRSGGLRVADPLAARRPRACCTRTSSCRWPSRPA